MASDFVFVLLLREEPVEQRCEEREGAGLDLFIFRLQIVLNLRHRPPARHQVIQHLLVGQLLKDLEGAQLVLETVVRPQPLDDLEDSILPDLVGFFIADQRLRL